MRWRTMRWRPLMSFLTHLQGTLIIVAWGYALCGMLFVLATNRELLAQSSRELFLQFPDIAVALVIIMALFPQYVADGAIKYVLEREYDSGYPD
jgi:hypothetical protein